MDVIAEQTPVSAPPLPAVPAVELASFTLDEFGRYQIDDADIFELISGGSNNQCGPGGGQNNTCNLQCA